jgi:hypothetical protein
MRCRGKVVVVVVTTSVVLAVVVVEVASVGVVVPEVAKEEEEEEELAVSRCDSLDRLATAASSAFSHLSSNVFYHKYMCLNRHLRQSFLSRPTLTNPRGSPPSWSTLVSLSSFAAV